MVKAIIFDWSGVISDDLALVHEITGKVFESLGREFMDMREFRERFDLPYMDFYKSKGIKVDKEKLDGMYIRMLRESGKKPEPFPYAGKTLEWLKKKGMVLAVLSSHPQELLESEVKNFGMSGTFSVVMGSAHDKRKVIGDLVRKLQCPPEEVVFVGDMAHDIETGKVAGIWTAAVLCGYHSRQRLEEKDPNFILSDIRDLKYVVDGVFA